MIQDHNQYDNDGILQTLIQEGQTLSAELARVKTEVNKEAVEDYQLRIDRFRNTIMKARNFLSQRKAELTAKTKLLELLEDALKTDKEDARRYMFFLIEEKKESQFHSTRP